MSEIIDLKQYKIIEQIGKGRYSIVYKVENISNKKIYAAKVSIFNYDEYDSAGIHFQRELHVHQNFNNEAIIKFYGYNLKDFDENNHPVILTKFMKNGDLSQILNKVLEGERTIQK